MAPMKRNRNRERKNIVRRRGKNSGRKGQKYSGSSDGSRVEKRTKRKTIGYKLETTGIRAKRKYKKMGSGRYSKLARSGTRGSSDGGSDSKGDVRSKLYIRKALEFGLESGYLIPDEKSGRQVLRVASEIMQFGGGGSAERSGSEGGEDGSSIEGRGRAARGSRSTGAAKRLIGAKSAKTAQKNIRKRGRSRTKSPKKPAVQKRRRKQSVGRPKTKARVQKRKTTPEAKNDKQMARKRGSTDVGGSDDEDEEPDPDADEDGDDKNGDAKKLPVSSRPGSAVPDSDNNATEGEKKGDDETSEPSGEEGSDEEEEEEEDVDDGLEPQDANRESEQNKTEN